MTDELIKFWFLNLYITMETISTTAVNKISLGNVGTDTSTVAAQSCTATFGLALIVGEDEQIVRADLNRRARQRLIRAIPTETLCSRRQIRCHIATIIAADGRRGETAGAQHIHETLSSSALGLTGNDVRGKILTDALGPVGHAHQHEQIRQEEECKHTNEIPTTRVHSN
jgi:hypothetical protein